MITWSIPQPPKRDLLARLGRRWAVVTWEGYDVWARAKYGRFWSESEAEEVAAQRNRAEQFWTDLGLHAPLPDPGWHVIDLMDTTANKEDA